MVYSSLCWIHGELQAVAHLAPCVCLFFLPYLLCWLALRTTSHDKILLQSQFSLPIQTIFTSHLLLPLAPGSTLFSGHPGVSDWSGRNWSNDQNLPRHCQASPWRLPTDDGDTSLCFSALLSTTSHLPGCPQGEGMWWVNRKSLLAGVFGRNVGFKGLKQSVLSLHQSPLSTGVRLNGSSMI